MTTVIEKCETVLISDSAQSKAIVSQAEKYLLASRYSLWKLQVSAKLNAKF
jgi:hypothetical protein